MGCMNSEFRRYDFLSSFEVRCRRGPAPSVPSSRSFPMVCAAPNPPRTGPKTCAKANAAPSQQLALLSVDKSEHHTDSIPGSLSIPLGKENYVPVASDLKAICVLDSSIQPTHGAVLRPENSASSSALEKESRSLRQWLLPCTQNNSGAVSSLPSFQQYVHHSSSSKALFPPQQAENLWV